ncbi:hypothetical protein Hypma_005946 [Hypsizygus marmoreus]|uniref:DUF6533 domain-containing protein n=1 Tax=Hypsizygus marmoreus TaxID=39966 RepID=A0A369KIG3_HYPMA|nr:hypothetical protein Hypma_005946 [Hypsizygus marmoreus]
MLAALSWSLLVCDWIVLFPREYENIWKRKPSSVQVLYIITRWVGLIGQTINSVWTAVLLSKASVPPRDCSLWFGYQITIMQCLWSAFDAINMLRVYALYNRSNRVGALLVFLWFLELGFMIFAGISSVKGFQFDSTCLVDRTPFVVIVMCAVVFCIQLVILSMTLAKRFTIGSRSSPLIQLATRDGSIVWFSFTVFFAIVLPYSRLVQVLPHSMFAIVISSLSALGCRIIMNLQCLDTKEQPRALFEAGPDPWSLDITFHDLNNITSH